MGAVRKTQVVWRARDHQHHGRRSAALRRRECRQRAERGSVGVTRFFVHETSYQPFFTTAPTSAPEIPLQERPEQRAINRQTKRSSDRWQGGNAISKGGDSKIPTTSVQVGGVVTLETNIKMCNK